MYHFIIVTVILTQSVCVLTYQEDLPYQNPDDDSMYFYMDTRSLKESPDKPREYDIEARRRSILEKNFVRLGRRDPLLQKSHNNGYDFEYDEYGEEFARPTRSGHEKNDHFVRFGRGKSDFVRFGRDSNKDKGPRDKDNSFVRFGRSINQPKLRYKRDIYNPSKGNSFLRFGKNDNFMRFGRKEDDPTIASLINNKNDEDEQRQSELLEKLIRYPESPIVRLLTKLAYKLNESNLKRSRLLD